MADVERARQLFFDGIASMEQEDFHAAERSFREALEFAPDRASIITNLAGALIGAKKFDEALTFASRAVELEPNNPQGHLNVGICMAKKREHEHAIFSYDRALAINPDYAEAWLNRGVSLVATKRHADALKHYDQVLKLKPDSAKAYLNRGLIFMELQQQDAAIKSYDQALAIDPKFSEAWINRAHVFQNQEKYERALIDFGKVLSMEPDADYVRGSWLHAKMRICDWGGLEEQRQKVVSDIALGKKVVSPFNTIALLHAGNVQRKAAEIYTRDLYPVNSALPTMSPYPRHEKIRVGYFSSDFRMHAVSILMAEVFEFHDRSKFELTAFAFGPDSDDAMRKRVRSAFDRFIDVSAQSDLEVAKLARSLEIDIAVDLGGYTENCRTGIFAFRAAPAQINYLGYPGTMGAGFMDYIIADNVVIPENLQCGYSEKIIYLPCFQANDSKRMIADRIFTREELGLPATGFVFCSFNNNYKYTPEIFDCWMRILQQVEGSVLFLFAPNDQAVANLKREAAARNVAPERLVFGKSLPPQENLARFRAADLFLDTLPFNAGTTASDALWAGLPVLTCAGEAFASRMAASLLHAIGLPELTTNALEDYERVAVELGKQPAKLAVLKSKLAQNRLTTTLFNTEFFTQKLEMAFHIINERQHAGLAPEHIHVV